MTLLDQITWTDVCSVDDIDPVLELLTKHNLLRRADAPDRKSPGRKPSPAYEVNPAAVRGDRPAREPGDDSTAHRTTKNTAATK